MINTVSLIIGPQLLRQREMPAKRACSIAVPPEESLHLYIKTYQFTCAYKCGKLSGILGC